MKFISFSKILLLLLCSIITNTFLSAQNIPNYDEYPTGTVTPFVPANFAPGIKVNYVRGIIPLSPLLDETAIQPTDPEQSKVSTQYIDGLGRVIQTVDHFASPNQNDIVSLVKYDYVGRDAWHFLPYTKEEATATDNGKFKLSAINGIFIKMIWGTLTIIIFIHKPTTKRRL